MILPFRFAVGFLEEFRISKFQAFFFPRHFSRRDPAFSPCEGLPAQIVNNKAATVTLEGGVLSNHLKELIIQNGSLTQLGQDSTHKSIYIYKHPTGLLTPLKFHIETCVHHLLEERNSFRNHSDRLGLCS